MNIFKLRIWRVVPTNQIGVQAPAYLVETTDYVFEKAEKKASKIARQQSGLKRFSEWKFIPTKLSVRKDDFGRYIPYHQ